MSERDSVRPLPGPRRRWAVSLCSLALVLAGCTSSVSSAPPTTSAHRPGPTGTSAAPAPATKPPSTSPPTTSPATRSTTSAGRPPRAREPLVVLDPGHNGGDATHTAEINRLVYAGYGVHKACNTTGTSTDAGYPEHAFTFAVALRVRAILRAHHVRVIMTRTNDHGVGPCVNRRAAIESRPGVDAAVAIHADGAPSSGHGFHVCEDSRRPEGASARTVRRSRDLGRILHGTLARSSGLVSSTYISHGYYFRDDLAGLNLSRSPTSFLELGNMRNAGDAQLQSTPAGRRRIAAAVAAGIVAYLHSR